MLPADSGEPGPGPGPERELQLGWFDWLTARRRLWFGILAGLYLLSFNGIWRVGVDSALYRGLARSLARGEGYIFAGEHHRHAYPGLPYMLAGLERLFGESPVPGLVIITLMALATLWLIDRTISLRFPLWVATVVTIGVGLNFQFYRQSLQLMTDVPFAFGVMLSLYALERLRLLPRPSRWTAMAAWALPLVIGLVIAAAMRPTFGVLALAIVFGSAFRLMRGGDGRRWLHAAILSVAVLVLLALFFFDPRSRGLDRFTGDRYELELMQRVGEIKDIIVASIDDLLGRHLDDLFFSQRLWYLAYPAAITLLVGGAVVLRRNVVWGLMIFGLVAITLPLSTVPRYFIMVAPFLWLGWVLLVAWLTLRLPAKWQGPVCALLLGFPMMANGARCVNMLFEQRKPDFAWMRGQSREDAFYATYRGGTVPRLKQIAQMIAEHSTKQQTVIGPEAHILAYYADRRVIGERTLFIDRDAALKQWPNIVAKAKPDLVIFPYGAYDESDALMRDLIRRRILVAELTVAKAGDVFLATATVRTLPLEVKNWRTYKAPAESSTKSSTGPATRHASVRRGSATQRAEVIAARERRLQKEAKLRRAERQAKADRRAAQERREKQAKIERRERIQRQIAKREKMERKERLERLERQKKKKKKRKRQPTTAHHP